MLLREHPEARCSYCGSPLSYGLKAEPTGWKVQYGCPAADGCGREFAVGRIDRGAVENEDEAHERAAALSDRL